RSVTERARPLRKQSLSASDGGGDGTASRRSGGSHEIGEGLHIIAIVLRVSDRIEGGDRSAQGVVLNTSTIAIKGIGDPHFVEVGVTRERLQTGVLVLPTEAGAAQRVAGLDHRNLNEGPHETCRLGIPNRDECVTVNTLDEAIADGVESRAEGPDVFERG